MIEITRHGNFRTREGNWQKGTKAGTWRGGSNKTKCKVDELFTARNNCEVTYSGSVHPKWSLLHSLHLPSVLSDFFTIGCRMLG